MDDLLFLIDDNFTYSYLLLIAALFLRKTPGVIPLAIAGVALLILSEILFVYWLRPLAAIVWVVAVSIGWRGRSMANQPSSSAASLLPAVPVNEPNFVTNAEALKHNIVNMIEALAAQRNIDVQVLSSTNHEPNPVIQVEIRNPASRERELVTIASATITILSAPFHRFDQLFEIFINNGLKTKTHSNVIALNKSAIADIFSVLKRDIKIRKFRPAKARYWPWQLWLPKNKISACGTINPYLPLIVFAAVFPPLALLIFFLPKRPTYRMSTGQPQQEPRRLIRLDSWQTRIKDVGFGNEQIREKMKDQLRNNLPPEVRIQTEKLRYWSPTGKVEREQLVVSLRRATAFIHIYPYGEDLYVGWDAHVNSGSWKENLVGSGFSLKEKLPVQLYSVIPTWHQPNEYDIFDASFISESVHATLTQSVKGLVKEHNIDQEIDFSIVRESRRSVTETEKPGSKRKFSRIG